MPFKKILVANRAEIASRIIRTLRVMGIPAVAIYTGVDRGAMHVRLAEESIPIEESPGVSGYMEVEKIIAAAKSVGADALHPGYGFFSCEPEAARKVIDAGLTWIGPNPETLAAMRDKVGARKIARDLGIPVLPAVTGRMADEELYARAESIGFPLMIKANLGQSGKALRLVRSLDELRQRLPWVKGDAIINFDDDQVYLEKALAKPHHIEVQITADKHGNVVHLWDRDCSVQRRYKQVLEEAPSPFPTEALRKSLFEAAVALAKKIGYVGAGGVEFLVDDDGHFYFLEMTCRIQASHPVTEWITGLDLVQWQVEIASGLPLPLTQGRIPRFGHAILARIHAEDPARDFAPSGGRINYLRVPAGRNVRNDSGVFSGWTLPPMYAPMISKLSVWGATREEAVLRMSPVLSEYRVGGVRNNIAFHQALNKNGAFRRGETHTAMLERDWWSSPVPGPNLKFVVAAALFDELEMEETRAQQPPDREGEAGAAQWKSSGRFNRLW